MRISTSQFYDNSIARLGDIQSKSVKLQEQLSSGKRILKPSDDPIASAELVTLKNSQATNSQYATSRVAAENSLNSVDSLMGSMSDLLASTKSSLIQANSSVLSNTDRAAIATQLKNNLDSLIGLANSKDANGNYMFAGQSVKTLPFPDAVTPYAGDNNQRNVQASDSRQIALSETGSNLFPTSTPGNAPDLFTAINNAITALNTPVVTAADKTNLTNSLATAQNTITTGTDTVLLARASVGARLNELDSLDSFGSALDGQLTDSISSLEDLDYSKALSDFSKQNTILEAAQKSFLKASSLSLFSMM